MNLTNNAPTPSATKAAQALEAEAAMALLAKAIWPLSAQRNLRAAEHMNPIHAAFLDRIAEEE